MRKNIRVRILKAITLACSASILSLSSFSAQAKGANTVCVIPVELTPYFAFDGQVRHMRWSRNFGGNLFKKYYPEADFSLGLKVSCYFGIEAGYRVGVTRTREVTLGAGETRLGFPVTDPPELHTSKAQFKGWHAAFMGYYPIYDDCLDLFGSVGLTQVRLFQKNRILRDAVAIFDPGTVDRTFKKTKTVLSLAAGVQMALDDVTSLRFRVGWENTAQFKTLSAREDSAIELKPKNSFSYGLGVVINFC